MALHSIRTDSALPTALSIISSLPRHVLSRLVTRMIERLDDIDGDADFQQADGDELDFNAAEDDFCGHSGWKCEQVARSPIRARMTTPAAATSRTKARQRRVKIAATSATI